MWETKDTVQEFELVGEGLSTDQEIRVEAVHAIALSYSGQNFIPTADTIIARAAIIEDYIKNGKR